MLRYIKISQWSYFGVPIAYGMEIYDITHSLYMYIVYTSAYLHMVLLKISKKY